MASGWCGDLGLLRAFLPSPTPFHPTRAHAHAGTPPGHRPTHFKPSHLGRGSVLSPDLGTLVGHFTLGSAHLVCASVCVCVCTVVPSVYPSHSLELHSWAHYSGDIKDAIFMDCCMIPKNE